MKSTAARKGPRRQRAASAKTAAKRLTNGPLRVDLSACNAKAHPLSTSVACTLQATKKLLGAASRHATPKRHAARVAR